MRLSPAAAARVILPVLVLALAGCTPVVTVPPDLLDTPTEPALVEAVLPTAPVCDPLAVSYQSTSCPAGEPVVVLDLGRPLAELGLLQVHASGALLGCSPVSGAPNLVQCSGSALRTEAQIVLTLCPGGCAPSGSCPAGSYFDTAFQACLPIPGGSLQPACPPGYLWDQAAESCLPVISQAARPQAGLSPRLTVASCNPGEYPDADSGSCQACPPGYSCDGAGMPASCPAGTYSGAGASSCSLCPVGTHNSTVGQGSCLACPPGTSALAGSADCFFLATSTPLPTCPDGYSFDSLFLTCLPLSGPTSPTCTTLVVQLPACP